MFTQDLTRYQAVLDIEDSESIRETKVFAFQVFIRSK